MSEDEHLQLLSGEGILYNKVARKRKKCNKTNSIEFKNEGVPSRELVLTISGGFQQVDLMGQWRGASNTRHSKYKGRATRFSMALVCADGSRSFGVDFPAFGGSFLAFGDGSLASGDGSLAIGDGCVRLCDSCPNRVEVVDRACLAENSARLDTVLVAFGHVAVRIEGGFFPFENGLVALDTRSGSQHSRNHNIWTDQGFLSVLPWFHVPSTLQKQTDALLLVLLHAKQVT
ncbi:MAG: hypothetical protein E6I91_18980, partial [Chloroflexi bacterium]